MVCVRKVWRRWGGQYKEKSGLLCLVANHFVSDSYSLPPRTLLWELWKRRRYLCAGIVKGVNTSAVTGISCAQKVVMGL